MHGDGLGEVLLNGKGKEGLILTHAESVGVVLEWTRRNTLHA